MLGAVSARRGGGGVYIKEDGCGGLQEKMDQQNSPSPQDTAGAAQMAPVRLIWTQLYQQAPFGQPQRDSGCLVTPSWWWQRTRDHAEDLQSAADNCSLSASGRTQPSLPFMVCSTDVAGVRKQNPSVSTWGRSDPQSRSHLVSSSLSAPVMAPVCHLLLFYSHSDTIDMLTFPLASTGERFGVVRRFQPFMDRTLERTRLQAVTKPRLDLTQTPHLAPKELGRGANCE